MPSRKFMFQAPAMPLESVGIRKQLSLEVEIDFRVYITKKKLIKIYEI